MSLTQTHHTLRQLFNFTKGGKLCPQQFGHAHHMTDFTGEKWAMN